ncbi:MAG TPA: ATP-dependent DNA helicase RecG [Alphaproteobacteria bacterium]|nr:ATP-dependent DNA helicase RecG [Alphaproteobacteria bacterium]
MRPEILFPLFAPVSSLNGVGPQTAKLITHLAGPNVVDLLWHLPGDLVDRRFQPKLAELTEAHDGQIVTLTLKVWGHEAPASKRLPYRVRCTDGSGGEITLIFFHARPDYLLRTLPEGAIRIVSGKLEHFRGDLQITHPDYILSQQEFEAMPQVEPVYGLTAGLAARTLYKAIGGALARAPALPEWQDGPWLRQNNWSGWRESLITAHRPVSAEELADTHPARMRLAYDELLANQLALMLSRLRMRRQAGRSITGDGRLRDRLIAALPFRLTPSQIMALAEISGDMASPGRMLRLLQGDVGSGKTIVALLSMLIAAENGGQAAIMAPTEILARQHYAVIAPWCETIGVKCALLTGRDKGKARDNLLAELADGGIPIIAGTHALFQEDVRFHDLQMAVIDEQHRFGVHQRLLLSEKGVRAVDTLVMSATPIPRTLTLTVYGDMDISRLPEKPPGRTPIDTRVMPLARLNDVITGLRRAVAEGRQGYWICPLVEESELIDAAAAEDRHAELQKLFGDRVGLVHGRMKTADKDRAMEDFAQGRTSILVATTVIEVGVDVPNASIMIIEHAQRFGLAQLHQLRGRVGRGAHASSCLLLYQAPLGEMARARLRILRETEDGFRIAEEDLRLRGAGEVLGVKQSGLPEFRVADLSIHGALLDAARDDARMIADQNPELQGPRGEALRILLYLFERDAAVKLVQAG